MSDTNSSETCGCCEGIQILTSERVANRPGLSALRYRVGTHSTFFETMLARLSQHSLDVPLDEMDEQGRQKVVRLYPLRSLRTRASDDPAIALLDAWATLADILTFYQERIANEAYLRTATERRSVMELARLVGYRPRPGVAASVYLAFTLANTDQPVNIPAGTRAQSMPANPGEVPQSFETSNLLVANTAWNTLSPRQSRPTYLPLSLAGTIATLYLDGTATNLRPNDPLLLVYGDGPGNQVFRKVAVVTALFAAGQTRVDLQTAPAAVQVVANLVEVNRILADAVRQAPRVRQSQEAQKMLVELQAQVGESGSPQRVVALVTKFLPVLRQQAQAAGSRKNVSDWVTAAADNLAAALQPAAAAPDTASLGDLVLPLSKPASLQPADSLSLQRSVSSIFSPHSHVGDQLLTAFHPAIKDTLYTAWANAQVTPAAALQSLQALRLKAATYAHTAALKPILDDNGKVIGQEEWPLTGAVNLGVHIVNSNTLNLNAQLAVFNRLADAPVQEAAVRNPLAGLIAQISVQAGGRPNMVRVPLGNQTVQVGPESVQVKVSMATSIRVRFANATNKRTINLLVDAKPVVNDLVPDTVSSDLALPPGSYDITAVDASNNDPVAGLVGANFSLGNSYTAVVFEDHEILLTADPIAPAQPGSVSVTFTNAIEGKQTISLAVDGQPVQAAALAPGAISAAVSLAPGDHSVLVNNPASPAIKNVTLAVTLTNEPNQEVFILGEPDLAKVAAVAIVIQPPTVFSLDFTFTKFQRLFSFGLTQAAILVRLEDLAQGGSHSSWELAFAGQSLQDNFEGGSVSMGLTDNSELFLDEITLLPPNPKNVIALDTEYNLIVPQSWVVIERPGHARVIARVTDVETVSHVDYNFPATVTALTLDQDWLDNSDLLLSAIRPTVVYAQSEPLTLAQEPIDDPICGSEIELASLYDGLETGRWLIIAGERTDIPNTSGVMATELIMISGVRQDVALLDSALTDGQTGLPLPGDRVHTFIRLASPLAYCYKRATAQIYGNVIDATHGETKNEVLGSGDGTQVFQTFALKQLPLTYVSAPTPSGVASTLQVRVNDLLWHEAGSLLDLGPNTRGFITRVDDGGESEDAPAGTTTSDSPPADKTSVVFGNGIFGARLSTGQENVKAVYRQGIGAVGNVAAGQISQLVTRPLGVTGVNNPQPSTGGADKETRDQARRSAPLGVTALDRLVSIQDYADFASTFAGIGKASAARLHTPRGVGRGQVLHLTIAGAEDIPIAESSDLYRNLVRALLAYGEPYLPIRVAVRELQLLVISAKVRLKPDYLWEAVAPTITSALQDAFGFDKRELGQTVWRSEVISAIQKVPGVAYVDLDILDAVPETITPDELDQLSQTLGLREYIEASLARLGKSAGGAPVILPAQLTLLSPEVPDTLTLTELSDDSKS